MLLFPVVFLTVPGIYFIWLNWFLFVVSVVGFLAEPVTVTISRCYKDVYVISFLPRTARLWNFLPTECFTLTSDLHGLSVGFISTCCF